MTSATRVRAVVLLLPAVAGLPTSSRAQDPCPSASAQDAVAGWEAYQANDMAEARRRFDAALARCANDQYARTGLGYVDLRDGDEAAAEAAWDAVLSAEPNNVDALVGLGLARWRAGDIDAVRERFSLVLDLSPGHPTAVEYLERVDRARSGAALEDDPAEQAWRSGNTQEAYRIYDERLATDPEDQTALLRMGLMRAWREEYGAALDLLDRLLRLQPSHLDGRLARARVRAWSGDIPGAEREVGAILEVQPDNAEALEALALFQAWAGQYEESLGSYDELLSVAPDHGGARAQRAQALAWAQRLDASRAAYDELLARDPADVEARLGLARTLGYMQDFDAAVVEYDRVLAGAPDDVRALTGKSRTLGWAGRLVESERAALQAVAANRSSAEAWASLGQAYRWQGRDAAALQAFETAAVIAPTNPEVRDQLRALDLVFSPSARPTVSYRSDSDDNRIVNTALRAAWHPAPRLKVEADGFYRQLDQGALVRTAKGATLTGALQLRPGWTVTGALGASASDGTASPSALEYRGDLRTPDRYPVGLTLSYATAALNETAWLAELGTTARELSVVGRWVPARGWRVDALVGAGSYEGTEPNGRRRASISASRHAGRFITLGIVAQGYSFEKDLDDGYFDPDFYGLAELTAYWLHRPGRWTLLLELAPGVQQVRSEGPKSGSVRTNARVAYRVGAGREVSLAFRYSSAGLVSFASTSSDYRFTSVTLGSSWVF